MFKKYFTLIVVPDATSEFKQIKVPYLLTRGLIVLSVVFVLSVAGLSFYMVTHYNDMLKLSTELPELRKNTHSQKNLLDRYEHDISELRQMVSRLKLVNAKLMLMAGVENPMDASVNLAVGGFEETPGISSLAEGGLQEEMEKNMRAKISNLDQLKGTAADQEELSQRMMEFFQDQQSLLDSTPSVWPVKGWVTSGFGTRKSPFTGKRTAHSGLDIATKSGTPIIAPANGIVSFAGTKGAFGKVMVIDHGNSYTTFYAHCKTLLKKVGDKVKRGDQIAKVGNTGRSTGSHLHYEVRVNGVTLNPNKYILDM
ncbi:MAG: M23 family metallopeptidase [bacterium]|nr:M23 family metallopeptidase [bacterium]